MRKTATKKTTATGDKSRPKPRKRSVSARKSKTHHKPAPAEKPVSVSSVRTQHTRKSGVARDVVSKPMYVGEVLGTLAGIAGGVLGVMTAVVATPIALALTGMGAVGLGVAGALGSVGQNSYRAAEKAVGEVSDAVGGLAKSTLNALENTSMKTVEVDNDLKRREYRDELGQLHHHTRT